MTDKRTKVLASLSWHIRHACEEDRKDLITAHTIISGTAPDAILSTLRDLFDSADNAYVMCILSNIAEDHFKVRFPNIRTAYRVRNTYKEAGI